MIRWLGVIFITIAGLSVWIFFSAKQTKPQSTVAVTMDGYMVDARYTQYDDQGQIHMTLHAPNMIHYADQSTTHFEKPEVLAYSQQRIPWTIQAAQGAALHDSEQVNLSGNVVIYQAPQIGYPETTILTNAMTIFPHRAYATTDQPIVITRPDVHITAVGMSADFKTGIFQLSASVKGSYAPPQKNPR